MQKDIHFYLTYALAKKAGIDVEVAEKIAWANQHTDELTKAMLNPDIIVCIDDEVVCLDNNVVIISQE
jgi:hypothetical protein